MVFAVPASSATTLSNSQGNDFIWGIVLLFAEYFPVISLKYLALWIVPLNVNQGEQWTIDSFIRALLKVLFVISKFSFNEDKCKRAKTSMFLKNFYIANKLQNPFRVRFWKITYP